MGVPDELKQKAAELLAQAKVATRDDLLDNNYLGFTLSPDYSAYANGRTTLLIDSLARGEVTHLKFTPMIDEGVVLGEPAVKGEVGAEEFARSETRRSGTCLLRAALNGFDLQWQENRNLLLPITVDEVPMPHGTSKKVLFITVKRPTTKERVSRPRKPKVLPIPQPTATPATPVTSPAAGAQSVGQSTAQPGTPPATQVPEGEKQA